MTFHLTHITTTGKKKGKQKFRNAAAAATSRALKESWEQLKVEHKVYNQQKKEPMKTLSYKLNYRGQGEQVKSLGTGVGVATVGEQKVYTGSAILGVAQMHKSNAVPVFSQEEAIDISKMRR